MRAAAILLFLMPTAASAQPDWRRVATAADRDRLSRWREAWVAGLEGARQGGHAADVAGPVFAFDRALPRPLPPAGDYRCRTTKLGTASPAMLPYVAYPWFACRIEAQGDAPRLVKLTGSQRQVGMLYPRDAERAVFLGTLQYGYEERALRYGRDGKRDVAGWVERIGERQWRLAMPWPAFESTIDVMELVPAR
ncbi:DUF4893 domain-containing protein [Sphingomonas corticis]|jgi:hypothetical protein|nr:DUF4893 domain-containing protein [Sphingomonas corticis]